MQKLAKVIVKHEEYIYLFHLPFYLGLFDFVHETDKEKLAFLYLFHQGFILRPN